jgi:DNA-binding MarR family transcriptional regulator
MAKLVKEPKLSAWKAFLKAHRTVIEKIENDLGKVKAVPLTSYDVLLELSQAPDRKLRMSELAAQVVLSRSGLTRLVDRLEKEGYLGREADPTDRRGTQAVLTPKGFEALKQAWPTYAQGINQHFAELISEQEAKMIAKVLERIMQGARS